MEKLLFPNQTRTRVITAVWFLLLLFVLCLSLIKKGDLYTVLWGLFCGAAGIAFYALKLDKRLCYLKLTPVGFEYKYYLPARLIEWKDVHQFKTYNFRCRRYVGWVYSDFYTGARLPFAGIWSVDGRFFENFDHKPETLVRLLEEWRKKY